MSNHLSPNSRIQLKRNRSSSVTNALKQIPLNDVAQRPSTIQESEVKPLQGQTRPRRKDPWALPEHYRSRGFINDLKTGRWMLVPASSLKLMLIPVFFYWQHEALKHFGLMPASSGNPFEAILWPGGRLWNGKYAKSWLDLLFVAQHIVFWSFVRQSVTIYILRPLAKWLGVPAKKMMRFTEQGYAVFYFGIMGPTGIYVMFNLPVQWYRTEYFWVNYPHNQMTHELKIYYLLQFSYWLQQTIILAGKVEKPRKDFKELVAHHLVTLWLVGWSYVTYHTYIGVAIFVTMDVSDIFLALAKCVNYFNEAASVPLFAFFVCVWTYFRHYLNIKILWSVLTEWEKIPFHARQAFAPWRDQYMVGWMKWQMFVPILMLQGINLFWYALILRILVRAVFTDVKQDERSDEEDEGEENSTEKATSTSHKGGKAQ